MGDAGRRGTAEVFDDLAGDLVSTMLIVTARRGDERSGFLVGFSTQISIDPGRFLVCLSVANHTYGLAEEATHLAVHVLPAGAKPLAELFGGETGDEVDKFAKCGWTDGPEGLPILDGCPSWFVGAVAERIRFGDHVGFVLDPVAAAHGSAAPPLTLPQVEDIEPGHDA